MPRFLIFLTLFLCCTAFTASSPSVTPRNISSHVVEYFNSENCKPILATLIFDANANESQDKCESLLAQGGAYVNYWVKSVRINGQCSNVQAYDTLKNSCLRFQ